ncbi:unnamed protein product [Didymodactylos carnosus]|uniref:Integrase catalytic domain-containing protein n=1 Tax=Didymodactylos carnosus TaxID=1234261 RepID=A0A815YLD7_9BILA|nr:unnamed protein product [Didymodactylos carnosus]CAF4437194.1 unnamed protein product [Didymodactylos carnosus]
MILAVTTRAQAARQTFSDGTTTTQKVNAVSQLVQDHQSDPIPQEEKITVFNYDDLRRYQQNDEEVKQIIEQLKTPKYKQLYFLKDELLMRRQKPKLSVPFVPAGKLRVSILKAYHDTPANGAHFGRDKTLKRIQERYFWPSLHRDTKNHVKSCLPCLQYNHSRRKCDGALKPIKPPEGVWQLLAMDYHGPIIPSSARGHKYIISITDIMSKFVIAKAVRDNSAKTAAEFLQQEVITKYGTPRCILTDNGSHFTAMMFNNLLKSIGATHLYSTPYHPQTNGQIERFNATMDAKIAVLANERKTNWHEQLSFVTFIYNTSVHATTKHIPFELMYGRKPVLPFDPQSSVVSTMERDEYLQYAKDYISSLTQDMKRIVLNSQRKYKEKYDLNRSNPTYSIGDLVLVKTTAARNKFSVRNEGPFRVQKQLGPKTYVVEHVRKPEYQKQIKFYYF